VSEAGSNSVEYWVDVFREKHVKNVDGVIELGRRFVVGAASTSKAAHFALKTTKRGLFTPPFRAFRRDFP